MGIKKPARRPGASSKQKKKKQIPKSNLQQKGSNVKQPNSGKALIIAQEIKFARLLASKDKKVRDKVLKNLKKWLTARSRSSFAFTEPDFIRLWKGLYYCMWMSDKPLVQEELAESISKIVHCFSSMKTALLYIKCTFKSLATEWFGIDQYRVDKFEMLLRRIIRQTFEMCKNNEWNKEWIVELAKILQELLVAPETSLGIKLHITEIYMEELAKVCGGEISEEIVTELIRPFAVYLSGMDDPRQMRHVIKNIFRYLIFQSDVGMDYLEKFEAWKQAGFPCGSIDAMEKVDVPDGEIDLSNISQSSDEEVAGPSEKALDPRAGRVDVEIPQIPFDPQQIANLLLEYRFHTSSTTKSRKQIVRLAKEFTLISQGEMPLGVKEIRMPLKKKSNPKKAAFDLIEFEQDLYADSNKAMKKRKRKSNEEADGETVNGKDDKPVIVKKKKLKPDNSEALDSSLLKQKQKQNILKKKTKIPVAGVPIANGNLKKKKHRKKNKEAEFATCGSWDVSTAKSEVALQKKANSVQSANPEEIRKKQNALSILTESLTNSKMPTLRPVLMKLEDQNGKLPYAPEKNKPAFKTPEKNKIVFTTPEKNKLAFTTPSKKRVKIMLQRNTAQHTSEYFQQLRQSPQIPYDANRKPRAGVLKPSPLPSPINPFYKRNSK
ncbi:ribosomal RNA processing protein 1 homolog [Belonocnema kinseyi]|uniref:ribosomal RNA processing protein 1 homolog n=1 Tax=Belonocnema kinseyi TaxID=2817044 RepID=UPI00143DC570|nr:ribosomal RNA processing protein 1 homolog [Belonocnema kinseyi]